MLKVPSTYMLKKYIKCNIWMVEERVRPIYRMHGSERLKYTHIPKTPISKVERLRR
jgi:hypothetical protein